MNIHACYAKLLQMCPTLCDPMDCTPLFMVLLPMGFSRQEDWSALSFSLPGDLPDPETESPMNIQGSLYEISDYQIYLATVTYACLFCTIPFTDWL